MLGARGEVAGSFSVTAQDDAGTAAPVGAIVNKVEKELGPLAATAIK